MVKQPHIVQVVTVNCARIIYGNQVATNGVVHVIDRVISAVGSTMQDVIEVDDDLITLNVSTRMKLHLRDNGSELIANCATKVGPVGLT